jgi:hypothetical protein
MEANPMRTVTAFFCVVSLGFAADWRSLFDGKTFAGWHDPAKRTPPGDGWRVDEGAIMAVPKAQLREDLLSVDTFGNHELEFEWRIAPGTNSGVKYGMQRHVFLDLSKVPDGSIQEQLAFEISKNASDRSKIAAGARGKDYTIGFEFQIIDDSRNADVKKGGSLHGCGSLYSLVAPSSNPAKRPGEWNQTRLVVEGDRVQHWINGVKVVDVSLDDPRIEAGLRKRWGVDHPVYQLLTKRPQRRSPVVLTHHGDQAWFRKLRIRELPAGSAASRK